MKRKSIALVLGIAIMITMLAPLPVMAASGGTLVKSVKVYSYNSSDKKWRIDNKIDYSYTKAFPTEIKSTYYYGETVNTTKVKYKMTKKGLPKSAKHYSAIGRVDDKWKYNKKGLKTQTKYGNYFKKESRTNTYAYNKQGFVKKYSYVSKEKYSSGTETYKGEYTYKYVMAKGLPKTMTSKRISNGVASTYSYIVTYNKKGLITKVEYVNSEGAKSPEYKVSYKMKKGKVTSATVTSYYDNKYNNSSRYVFKYTKDKANKARYANMINSVVMGTGSFGAYNWY